MIYCIVGPTASNKSLLAEKIANFHQAIVINCDAYQVYIEMNKGTAKPSLEFLKDTPTKSTYLARVILLLPAMLFCSCINVFIPSLWAALITGYVT